MAALDCVADMVLYIVCFVLCTALFSCRLCFCQDVTRCSNGRARATVKFGILSCNSHMGNDRAIDLALAINTRCRFLPCWLSKIVAFSVRVTKDKKT